VDTDSGAVAVVAAQGDNADRVDFGFRYDDRYNAALLFGATVRHIAGFASTGRLSLRLGEQTRVALDVDRGRPFDSHWVLGGGMSYLRTPLDFFDGRRRIAEASLRVATASLTAGGALGPGGVGVQVKGEDVHGTAAIAAVDSSQHRTFASAAALLWWDTMDRPEFPRAGTALRARYERAVGGGEPFTRMIGAASAALPIGARVSLSGRMTAGASSRDGTIPFDYRFFLGSLTPSAVLAESQVPFAGFQLQERNGFAVAQAGGAVQWEVVRNVFAVGRVDVGNVAATFSEATRSRVVGLGLSVGSRTLMGPVVVSMHGRSMTDVVGELGVGRVF
jgi:outer membrane protein assembly factor BamA